MFLINWIIGMFYMKNNMENENVKLSKNLFLRIFLG